MATSAKRKRFISHERLAIGFVIVALTLILLGLLSYFWLPGFVKSKVETILSETLHRPVTVESIDIHLYSMELTLHGLRVGEKATSADAEETFLSFEKLYVDLSINSIGRRAPVISAITLQAPTIRLVREDEDLFNISDLIEEFSQPSDDDEEDEGEARFSVSNIVIEGGYFELVDRFKESHQVISEVNLGVPFVANFERVQRVWVQPHFSALINGAPISLDGKVRPFTDRREATLELKFDDIDLTLIDEYAPIPAGISLNSAFFDSDLLLTFSQLADEDPSITLSGATALRRLDIENSAVETPYRAVLGRLYAKLIEVDLMSQKPSRIALVLDNAALLQSGESVPVVSLPRLIVKDIMADVAKQQVEIDEIILDRFNASVRRKKDGNIDLAGFFAPLPGDSNESTESNQSIESREVMIPIPVHKPADTEHILSEPEKQETDSVEAITIANSEEASADEKPWVVRIGKFNLNAAALRFEDLTLTNINPMVINPLNIVVKNIDLTGTVPVDLAIQAKVNQQGSIETKGSIAWSPIATDLDIDVKTVDIVSLQGWAGDELNALLTSGAISFQGNIKADGDPLRVAIIGQGQLSDFNVFDKKHASDLLHWETLNINDIDFVNEPLNVDIASIELGNFYARIKVTPEGNINLNEIVPQNEEARAEVTEEEPATTAANSEKAEPMPVSIGQIVLQQGNVNFNDKFIKPTYRSNITGLSGEIGPVHPDKSVKIDLRGAIDKSAPLEIKGSVAPFSSELQLDIMAKVKGIDMPTFSPYSGKHIGYHIEKGKLSVDIHYSIEKGALKAKNHVFLDQFTLGEEVEGSDAPSLPLSLAVSLLKNKDGEIDINLPVEGSLDDPQFSIGGIIFDAFINLIMRAITSPFALLGSVLGDGEELSMINFTSGSAAIDETAEHSLQTLSQALIDRPSLKLEITGYTSPVEDEKGMKAASLEHKVKALKLAKDAKEGKAGGSLDDVELDPEEYEEFLTVVYKQASFKKPTNMVGLAKSLPVEEMEELMLANTEVSDDEMRALAESRANAARHWLMEQGEVPGDRVFVLGVNQSEVEADEEMHGGRAEFGLK